MQPYSLAKNFDEYFRIKLADSDELKRESYKIRHSVYAQELGWEPPSETGMETDECDEYATPLLLEHRRTGHFAGTVRLVLPPKDALYKPLPFELHCFNTLRKQVIDPASLSRGQFGEISRLAVPAEFRKRVGEDHRPYVVAENNGVDIFCEEERRNFPNIAIGLYLSIIAMVDILEHSHVFVVIEPRLNKRLSRLGLNFVQCGDELDYHGIRALFVLERDNYYSNLNPELLALYELLKNEVRKQLQNTGRIK